MQTKTSTHKKYSYLALGDSYTIGEKVPATENFPNQVVQIMNDEFHAFMPPRIIAKTGWTTDELQAAIIESNTVEPIHHSYDFVSLLIGVNNQYRGLSKITYKFEFEQLIRKAIDFASNNYTHIVVLSIPDWGVTPFAKDKNRLEIAQEIDIYNTINKEISLLYNVHYIDITASTRLAINDTSLLASDGLHPSAKEYKSWAKQVAIYFKSML